MLKRLANLNLSGFKQICLSKQQVLNISFSKSFSTTDQVPDEHNQQQSNKPFSKKYEIKIKNFVQKYLDTELPDKSLEDELKSLKKNIKSQSDKVRQIKKENAQNAVIDPEIVKLESFKKEFKDKIIHLLPIENELNQFRFTQIIKNRFIYDNSFSIYESVSGLFDYGPIGCAIQTNFLNEWRKFFVLKDHMLEIDCAIITPEPVLQASGHLSKFNDYMVKDIITNEAFRVDHLLKSELEKKIKNKSLANSHVLEKLQVTLNKIENSQIQSLSDIDDVILEFDIRSPVTGNAFKKTEPFNLMFQTLIGPSGHTKGYLRPETAQGIFTNFKSLLKSNQNRLPMQVAQIGKAFRNEINPKSGIIRQREFLMAEIEHFLDPSEKCKPYSRFKKVEECYVNLYTADDQQKNLKTHRKYRLRDAVNMGLIKNETVAYYIGKVALFLKHCGIDENRMKFRQHLIDEMAHYASDCWDVECETSYGWIECVGIADRGDYDLTQHANHSGNKLAFEKYTETKTSGNHENANRVEFIPHVVEPSFGIGRIMYAILEQNFKTRSNDANRCYFSVPISIAPYKCVILPLTSNSQYSNLLESIAEILGENEISYRIDDTDVNIGKRYVRSDEIGIPFAITLDAQSLANPCKITIRDRDSMKQIRVELKDFVDTIRNLVSNKLKWDDLHNQYGL